MTAHAPAMRVWAIVPAKSFARAKSRLDGALAPSDRRALARELLERSLVACTRCRAIERTLVATDGDDVAQLAARHAAEVTRDLAGASRLASIVDAALAHARRRGATHAIVLMADLPQVRARDLAELSAALRDHDAVVVPDAHRRGTGALALRLGERALHTCFGHADSFMRHVAMARAAGLSLRVLTQPRLARDLDAPIDAAELRGTR